MSRFDRCVECGEYLGIGDTYYCRECDELPEADVPEDRCDGCSKVRPLADLGFGWFCDDCANEAESSYDP